ncbi:tetratricopeptide repeat protein [Aquimarina spongiae]|uniref:Tetratricopeptide repeat-containing protein n=1 Tax=Aquimarina spongiae TaxID=570521 RepID=A0A1M6D6J4_9FLAO|nr:hypothetical protein [Aquimarina spongiae]SHI68829.1 hypothetical protein SAMN04488508_102461 [Aquimarina spongiae]
MSNFLEEIDKYLDNIMTREERRAFEERVDNDSTLAEELKLQKDMRTVYDDNDWIEGDKTALKNDEAKQLRNFFASDEAKSLKASITEVMDNNRLNSGNKRFYFLGIAASIIVLMTISIFVFSESDYNDLYADNIALEEIPSMITRGEEENELINNAQTLFENKKYREASDVFSKYHNSDVDTIDPLSYIYKGVAHLELNEFDKALGQFGLLEQTHTLQSKKADWYRAMVYLKQEEKEKLRQILLQITSDSTNYNFERAKALLEDI